MDDLIKIIRDNNAIDFNLKEKIIECSLLIINKYPIAYGNLYKNLQTAEIRYNTTFEETFLKEKEVDSKYNAIDNTLTLPNFFINEKNYRYILIHELLHISSNDEEHFGLKAIEGIKGISLNEGMSEYLTQEILENHSFGMKRYSNDTNNIMLFSNIIPYDELIDCYFKKGILGLFRCYVGKINSSNNLNTILDNMDKDHIERVKNNKFNNEYKDKYIRLMIEDITKIETKDLNKNIIIAENIIKFLKCVFENNEIPESLNESLETLLKKINIGSNNYEIK